jgi:hypothetical protein
MEQIIERVGGLDVHKQSVVACVRVPGAHGSVNSTYGPSARRPLRC